MFQRAEERGDELVEFLRSTGGDVFGSDHVPAEAQRVRARGHARGPLREGKRRLREHHLTRIGRARRRASHVHAGPLQSRRRRRDEIAEGHAAARGARGAITRVQIDADVRERERLLERQLRLTAEVGHLTKHALDAEGTFAARSTLRANGRSRNRVLRTGRRA